MSVEAEDQLARQCIRGFLILVMWLSIPLAGFRPDWLLPSSLGTEVELLIAAGVALFAGILLWHFDRTASRSNRDG
jgi:hypothetical protein